MLLRNQYEKQAHAAHAEALNPKLVKLSESSEEAFLLQARLSVSFAWTRFHPDAASCAARVGAGRSRRRDRCALSRTVGDDIL